MSAAHSASKSVTELSLSDSGWLAWAVSKNPQRVNGSFAFFAGSLVLHGLFAVALSRQPEPAPRPLAMQAEILIEAPEVVEEPEPEPPPPEPEPPPPEAPAQVPAAVNPPPDPLPPQPEAEPPAEEPPEVMDNPYADPDFDFSYRRPTKPGNGTKSIARPVKVRQTPTKKAFGISDAEKAKRRAERAKLLQRWFAQVIATVNRRAGREYPRRARQLRQEGRALLALVIDSAGNVTGVSVRRSSGHALLDSAALRGASSIGRVPAPPQNVRWRTNALLVPVAFVLQ